MITDHKIQKYKNKTIQNNNRISAKDSTLNLINKYNIVVVRIVRAQFSIGRNYRLDDFIPT